jgi:hypothetical protein
MSVADCSRLRAVSKILSIPNMSILFGFVLVPLREIETCGTELELWSWGWELNPYNSSAGCRLNHSVNPA